MHKQRKVKGQMTQFGCVPVKELTELGMDTIGYLPRRGYSMLRFLPCAAIDLVALVRCFPVVALSEGAHALYVDRNGHLRLKIMTMVADTLHGDTAGAMDCYMRESDTTHAIRVIKSNARVVAADTVAGTSRARVVLRPLGAGGRRADTPLPDGNEGGEGDEGDEAAPDRAQGRARVSFAQQDNWLQCATRVASQLIYPGGPDGDVGNCVFVSGMPVCLVVSAQTPGDIVLTASMESASSAKSFTSALAPRSEFLVDATGVTASVGFLRA